MMVVDFFNASGNRLPRGGPLRNGGSEHLGDQNPRSYFIRPIGPWIGPTWNPWYPSWYLV
jgi:hypothetical protein